MKEKQERHITCFIMTAGAVFVATALAKLVSALGDARILDLADPLLGLKTRHLLACVGVVEAVLAGYLFFGRSSWLKLSLTAWMATNFLVYRLAIWWMDAPKPCGCLGTVTDALPVSPRMVDYGMKGILAYLLIGSLGLIGMRVRSGDRGTESTVETNVPA